MLSAQWRFLRYFLTIFTAILIPTYWYYYGPQNFLWLSDIGLFLTVVALWFPTTVLMSIAAVGILFVELLWAVDFFAQLVFNVKLTGLSDYMFDNSLSSILRAFSLFHLIVPTIWIFYLAHYGYHRRAVYYFIPFYWLIVLATYCYTLPEENINWVFWPTVHHIQHISPPLWVAILTVIFPLLILLPTHFVLKKLFRSAR